jgi:hypothetical protein
MDTVIATLVVFTTRMVVSLPFCGESCRLEHGSTVDAPATGAVVDVTASVGSCAGVLVGGGVLVGASVGGRGVAVGTAAWVCATMVNAAATAVFWTSTGFTVGAAGAPHALMSIVKAAANVMV